MKETLNELYSEYYSGGLKRNSFEGLIYTYFIYNQEKTCISHWKRDEYEDFLSWFYPRMRIVIDSYHETGASFEAFLFKYFLVSAKEYHVRTTTNSIIEYSAWCARVPEMYVHEESPVYNYNKTEDLITKLVVDINGKKNTRRILALILKCYYYVSENFAEKIAPLIGIDSKELIEMLNKIRKIREKKDDQIYLMKERTYCQFYRCFIYDKRHSLIQENTIAYEDFKSRKEKARLRLKKMRSRMASIRTEATNKQIAEVIGTTKGTVDASLHRLKEKWKIMAEKAALN